MSLVFMDGFDHYATSDTALTQEGPVVEKWSSMEDPFSDSLIIKKGAGRFGGDALFHGDQAGISFLEKVVPANEELIIGFSLKIVQEWGPILNFGLGGNLMFSLRLNQDNTLKYVNANGTVVASSVGPGLALNTGNWFHMEMKANVGSDDIELRVNEEVWIQEGNANLDPDLRGGLGDLRFVVNEPEATLQYYIDDFYVMDTVGARLNDFIGDSRIDTLLPIANGAQIEFTPDPGTAANYENVDDPRRDEDATYNFANIVGHRDLFEMEDIGTTPLDIHALQATISARKDDAGTRGLKAVVTPGGNIHLGDEELLNQDYLYEMYIFELSPETGLEWTISEINTMEAGYQISS